ncbi:MAG: ion transporter [Myxococcota bacterium]
MEARRLSPIYVEPQMPVAWDRFIIVLTVAAIALIFVDMGLEPESSFAQTLGWIDVGLCSLFVIDFGVRFSRASAKWHFVKRNWYDLLGAIPLVGPLRAARFIRLIRLVRLTRIGFLLLRLIRRYDLPVPLDTLGTLTAVTTVMWLGSSGLFFYFESQVNAELGIDDALWWGMTTLSTVGYGDLYPSTDGGRVVAITTMIMGIGVLGTLAATIATAFVDLRDRGRRGMRSYMLKNHVLVLGWNDKAAHAIDELRQDPRYHDTKICVVADLESTPIENTEVKFVRGTAAHPDSLRRASADHAGAAIVFASDPTDGRSDYETASIIHMVRRVNQTARISAELIDPEHREQLVAAGCDAVVDLAGITSNLLVRSVLDVGVCDVVSELLSTSEGCEIYRIDAPKELVGATWKDASIKLLEDDCTLLGVLRTGAISVNPGKGYSIKSGDELFVVSEEPP